MHGRDVPRICTKSVHRALLRLVKRLCCNPLMNVVLVEPFFPSNQRQFARALAEAGATVIGIGEYGVESFDDDLKGWLHHYERVSSVTDADAMTRAVRWVQDKLWVDRLEATIEAHTMAAAQVREACTIPGTSV